MNALHLTLFVSLGLAAFGVLFFLFSRSQKTGEHLDRLALLPLEDDEATPTAQPRAPITGAHNADNDEEPHA